QVVRAARATLSEDHGEDSGAGPLSVPGVAVPPSVSERSEGSGVGCVVALVGLGLVVVGVGENAVEAGLLRRWQRQIERGRPGARQALRLDPSHLSEIAAGGADQSDRMG